MIHLFTLIGIYLVWVIGGFVSGLWNVHEKYADLEAPPVTDIQGFCKEMREKNLGERQIKLLERSGKYYKPEKMNIARLFSLTEKQVEFYRKNGLKTEKVTYINNSMEEPICREFTRRKDAMWLISESVKDHERMFAHGYKTTKVENGVIFECPRMNFTAKFEYEGYTEKD